MSECTVRRVCREDIESLLGLCAEHAAFERAPYGTHDRSDGLSAALFGPHPTLQAWVATHGKESIGYATATEDFSTWLARPYLHMDCLYVRAGHRGRGTGATLLGAVLDYARARQSHEVQWQTPAWNADARRFYSRFGATSSDKTRFNLPI